MGINTIKIFFATSRALAFLSKVSPLHNLSTICLVVFGVSTNSLSCAALRTGLDSGGLIPDAGGDANAESGISGVFGSPHRVIELTCLNPPDLFGTEGGVEGEGEGVLLCMYSFSDVIWSNTIRI